VGEVRLGGTYASVEATHGERPLLVAASGSGELSVFEPSSGRRLRTLSGAIVHAPTLLQAAQ
jgi:hypothetical protein